MVVYVHKIGIVCMLYLRFTDKNVYLDTILLQTDPDMPKEDLNIWESLPDKYKNAVALMMEMNPENRENVHEQMERVVQENFTFWYMNSRVIPPGPEPNCRLKIDLDKVSEFKLEFEIAFGNISVETAQNVLDNIHKLIKPKPDETVCVSDWFQIAWIRREMAKKILLISSQRIMLCIMKHSRYRTVVNIDVAMYNSNICDFLERKLIGTIRDWSEHASKELWTVIDPKRSLALAMASNSRLGKSSVLHGLPPDALSEINRQTHESRMSSFQVFYIIGSRIRSMPNYSYNGFLEKYMKKLENLLRDPDAPIPRRPGSRKKMTPEQLSMVSDDEDVGTDACVCMKCGLIIPTKQWYEID